MSQLLRTLLEMSDEMLSHLVDPACLLCGLPVWNSPLCADCWNFPIAKGKGCERCGCVLDITLASCPYCPRYSWGKLKSFQALWLLEYREKELMKQVKYHQPYTLLEKILWTKEKEILKAKPDLEGFVLIPIPQHPLRFFRRPFNPAEMIAGFLSRFWQVPWEKKYLQKIKQSPAQAQLNRRERLGNLKGSMSCEEGLLAPKKVFLVDDVLTTGSTLSTASRALFEAGSEEIRAFTLFRTPILK